MELIRAGVDYQIRETVESAYLMGTAGLRAQGYADLDIEEATDSQTLAMPWVWVDVKLDDHILAVGDKKVSFAEAGFRKIRSPRSWLPSPP